MMFGLWSNNPTATLECTSMLSIRAQIVSATPLTLGIPVTVEIEFTGITATFATVGFTSSTFTVTEGVQSSCQVCIQLLAGTIRKTVSAYVATSALGIGQAYVDYIPLNEEEVVFKSGAS